MLFSLSLLAAAAGLASAATSGGNFTISNPVFETTSGTNGQNGTTQYHFTVQDSLRGGETTCNKTISGTDTLPTFNYTACADPTWSFALFKTGKTTLKGQYSLQITRYQVIDGHRTNNETSCNTDDEVDAYPSEDPQQYGDVFDLVFNGGASTFNQSWAYTSPTKYYCPS